MLITHLPHPSCSAHSLFIFFLVFFLFFSNNHAWGSTTHSYTLLHHLISTGDMVVGFYIYSSSLLLLEHRSRIVKHAWRLCLPLLMVQTKTNKEFQKSLRAVSKLWRRRSSQLFSSPLIYVAYLPLSGPFVCLVCIQKIHPCHPLPTLEHRERKKKKTEGPQRGETAGEKAGRKIFEFLTLLLLCKCQRSKLSWEGNWTVS